MDHLSFTALLKQHQSDFAHVVPFKPGDKVIPMVFSEANKDLTDAILEDEDQFTHYIYQKLENEHARYGIGGYDEHRTLYRRSTLFGAEGEEARSLHLGTDIWGRPHTAVIAPMDGIVHSLGNNNEFGDYGATIILSHQLEGFTFHTLYGHLSLNSLKDLQPGNTILKGDYFAEFGMPSENGHWPPHLHFQIVIDLEGWEGNYPGVCKYSEREKYLANCPDADLVLNMMQYVEDSRQETKTMDLSGN
ncbi:MAG: peptidoglycan DD-metalloendopeptidase family protein [Flavisolibacter sp.]|jgi:murein DD-endopeptidase MepM/ murein hydrolase activator NlpD|nr:peptidoglycan DD-metalloendopeptidase family protein [Flavisolibacter sp.]